jgi:dephospho-CoA kinase
LRQEREEEALFSISQAIRRADMTLENNDTLEAFHRRIEEALIDPVLADAVDCRGDG